MSAESPFESETSTSPGGAHQRKKNIFEIWRAHTPPYIATVSAHDPADLAEKVSHGLSIRGPKLFLSLAVCPTGWGFEPARADEIAQLAIQTGVWPLKEAIGR